VAEEKMSSAFPHPAGAFLTIFDHTTEQPLMPTLLWIFSIEMNRFMNAHGYKKEDIALVAVKNKKNALDHPSAQLGAEITVKDVLDSEIMACICRSSASTRSPAPSTFPGFNTWFRARTGRFASSTVSTGQLARRTETFIPDGTTPLEGCAYITWDTRISLSNWT